MIVRVSTKGLRYTDLALRDSITLSLEGEEKATQPKKKGWAPRVINHEDKMSQEGFQEVMKKKKDFIQDHYNDYKLNEPSNSEVGDCVDPSSLCQRIVQN